MFLSRLKFLQCLRISKAKAIKNKFKADAFKEWKCERFKIPLVNIYGVVGGGRGKLAAAALLSCCLGPPRAMWCFRNGY